MKYDIFLVLLIIPSLFLSLFDYWYIDLILVIINVLALIPVVKSALKALSEKEISVDLLAVVALTFSVLVKEWQSAAFINLMLTSARIFSAWTEKRTESALKSLLKYKPKLVKLKKGDGVIEVKPSELKIGDIVVIGPGERIATDGIVLSGESVVDESTLTGESIPKTIKKGSLVYSSALNISGVVEVSVTKLESQSALSKIILSIEEATLKKSKTIKFSSRFASWYILITLIASIVIYAFTKNSHFTLSILLIVCADDLAVSIPLAFTMAIATATKKGILVKSSDVLENLPKVKTIFTDKTGTLTNGRIKIDQIVNLSKLKNDRIYSLLGSIALNSTHPLSREIVSFVNDKNIKPEVVDSFKDFPGEGGQIRLGNENYLVGKISFLKSKEVSLKQEDEEKIEKYINSGFSISGFSKGSKLLALIVFEDKVKENAKLVIYQTKKLGVNKWIMLTGDIQKVADKVARDSGVDEYKYLLSPSDKLSYIESYKKEKGEHFAMIGDGVNDAPSLSLADVSISMGAIGSDVAINASDIAIMDDNLEKVVYALKLSKNVQSIVKQNVLFWFLTNAVGLVLVIFGVIGPTGAATYNFVTDFITTINSLRVGFNKHTKSDHATSMK